MEKDILIVDDDKDILTSLREILQHQGNFVFTAESGFECIKRIKDGFQGILLIDIMMPKMDGWDTIKEIVERGLIKNVAINIITGKGTKHHKMMSVLGTYIYDYFSKPLDIDELIECVKKCENYLNARSN